MRRTDPRTPARDVPAFRARITWWRDLYFDSGLKARHISGVDVRVTDPPRTVIDLVRFRGNLGNEPAMKALDDFERLDGSLPDLRQRAREVGALDAVKPFIRAARTTLQLIHKHER